MRDCIDHLPVDKQADLCRASAIIRDMCDDVEMIILFGSYARGDYREESDLPENRKSGAPSDYDILVVNRHPATTADSQLWSKISEQCNGHHSAQPFRIIVHDIKDIKERLRKIHYFFSDIVKEGCLLYNAGNFQLNVNKELSVAEQLEVATEHFEHWFARANVFFEDFQSNFSKGPDKRYANQAAFHLHQTAESAYKALLLVHTNYSPYEHFLASMSHIAHEVLPDMEVIFPCLTQVDQARFKNFEYAYIGARYDPKFKISKEDLDYLASRVKRLLELTEKLCQEKFKTLNKM